MHILIIPSWYSTDSNSFTGSYFREQAHALSKEGHKVNIVYIENRYTSKLFSKMPVQMYADNGFKVYTIQLPLSVKGIIYFFPGLISFIGIHLFEYYCKQEGSPDLLHAHSAKYAGFIASVLNKRFAVPYVLTEHLSKLIKKNIPFHQKSIFKAGYKNARRIFAVSNSLAGAMKPLVSGRNIEIFENMVDEEFFNIPENAIPETPFIFTAIGNLIDIKGDDLLIKAFYQSQKNKNAKLLIAGEGNARKKLQRLITQLELENQVSFLGSLSREEVKRLLQSSHVLVSSSLYETFGITLIEAMACGLPVLSTRSGGPDTIVTIETGLLVKPGDIAQLAGGLKMIRENYPSYNKGVIRKSCIEKYGKKHTIEKLLNAYHETLQT